MSEPPVTVGPDGVELQPRKVGRNRLDMVIALSAITISVVSLVTGVLQGRTQERLEEASTWPLLEYGGSNLDDGRPVISLGIENSGVGPALLRDLIIRYDGKPVHTFGELFQRCCGFAPGVALPPPGTMSREQALTLFTPQDLEKVGPAVTSTWRRVYAPGESVTFLRYPQSEWNRDTFRQLDEARRRLTFEACYCSALDRCWRSDLVSMDPEPVRSCPAPGPQSYTE